MSCAVVGGTKKKRRNLNFTVFNSSLTKAKCDTELPNNTSRLTSQTGQAPIYPMIQEKTGRH